MFKFVPVVIFLVLYAGGVAGQVPPLNPFIIDSPFPFVHQNNYRQGYSNQAAFLDQESIIISTTTTPNERVSPWLQLSEAYPDGSRTIWGSSSTHIWKAVSGPSEITLVDDYQVDFDPTDRSWSFLMLPNRKVLTSDNNRLLVFTEQDINDPLSAITLEDEIVLPASLSPVKFNRLYDGNIMFASGDGTFGLLSGDLQLLDTFRLDLADGETAFQSDETAFHNDYASDENGGVYIVTTKRMIRLQVANEAISLDWSVEMDFGGSVFQGVGTTPTLLGTTDDRLVCVVNSKTPAEMVVFWRDEIPTDWTGLPGMNQRVAAVVPLPGSSPINNFFAAVENSPVAYGYGIACAQYNGFLGQDCPTAKGVYKLEWNTTTNTMALQWSRTDINLNNVLVYSRPDDLIYGSGREDDCNYYYYGIDWNTGETSKRFFLGEASYFDDPGDANIILESGAIVVNTNERLIQYTPGTAVAADDQEFFSQRFSVAPNPFTDRVIIQGIVGTGHLTIALFDAAGKHLKTLKTETRDQVTVPLTDLPAGLYFLRITSDQGAETHRVIKR